MARNNPLEGYKGETITNPVKAIDKYCTTICTYTKTERDHCGETSMNTCPLYAFRYGTNPYRQTRTYTDEEKAAMAERLKSARNHRAEKSDCSGKVKLDTEGVEIGHGKDVR